LVIHISLVNEVQHSGKFTSSISTAFQQKYPFQSSKNKNPFPLHDIKIRKKQKTNEVKNRLKKQKKKKKKMECKQYILEQLQNMFEKEQNPKELNKIM